MTTTIRDHWRGLTDDLTADQITELETAERCGLDGLYARAEDFVWENHGERLTEARKRLADHPLPAGAIRGGDWELEGMVPWRRCEGATVRLDGGLATISIFMDQREDRTDRYVSLEPMPALNVHDLRAMARALMAVADQMVEDSERD